MSWRSNRLCQGRPFPGFTPLLHLCGSAFARDEAGPLNLNPQTDTPKKLTTVTNPANHTNDRNIAQSAR